MDQQFRATQIAFLLLTCFAVYTTWGMFFQNGGAGLMQALRDHGPHLLPGTKEPLRTHYVGVAAIDYQLTVLTLFFWELFDGSHPGAFLLCAYFAGQMGSAYVLLMMNGLRHHKHGTMLAPINVWGFAIQNITFAVSVSAYLLLEFSFFTDTIRCLPGIYFADEAKLLTIPFSVAIGYFLPLILFALPAPAVVSYHTKQLLMSSWQVFPLWVIITQLCLTPLVAATFMKRGTRRVAPHRPVYMFAVLTAFVTQVATLTVIVLSKLNPELFAPKYHGAFEFATVFRPSMLIEIGKVASIGDGAHLLLQYDFIVGSLSMLLWGAVSLGVANSSLKNPKSKNQGIVVVTVALLLTGPMGCTAVASWIRDEIVMSENDKILKEK